MAATTISVYGPSNGAHWGHCVQAAAVTAPGTWAELEKGAKLSICSTNLSKVRLEPKTGQHDPAALSWASIIPQRLNIILITVIFNITLITCAEYSFYYSDSLGSYLWSAVWNIQLPMKSEAPADVHRSKIKEKILFLTKAGIFLNIHME